MALNSISVNISVIGIKETVAKTNMVNTDSTRTKRITPEITPSFNVLLIQTNSSGNEQWSKEFISYETDIGYSVQQITDAGYIITGTTEGRVLLIKTDNVGNKQWSKKFDNNTYWNYNKDYRIFIEERVNGGYIITRFTENNIYAIKTDRNGIEQ